MLANTIGQVKEPFFIGLINNFSLVSIWFVDNIGGLALCITLVLTFTFVQYVIANSVKQSSNIVVKVFRTTIVCLSAFFFIISMIIHTESTPPSIYFYNLFGLIIFVWTIGIIRMVVDHLALKKKSDQNAKFFKNLRDTFWNTCVFIAIYAALMYAKNDLYRWSGYLLCSFNIFRMIKYGFIDDIILGLMNKPRTGSPPQNQGIILTEGLFSRVLRTYLYISVSYGCIYTLMNLAHQNSSDPWFSYDKHSCSDLLDFIYFSVVTLSTVGYGDISPIHWIPKLLSLSEILIGYFFISALMALILSRYNSYAETNALSDSQELKPRKIKYQILHTKKQLIRHQNKRIRRFK